MSSSKDIDHLISIGKTVIVDKRLVAGMSVLWIYDYLLTLSDEIKYIWTGKTSLILGLFALVPPLVLHDTALCIKGDKEQVLAGVVLAMAICGCDRTSWFPQLYATFTTLFAQAVITLRIYAVTGNNWRIASCLAVFTFVQFTFGVYLSVRFALQPATALPDFHLDGFRICFFHKPWRTGETIYSTSSAIYDSLSFLIIVYSAKHRGPARAHGAPNLLDKILRDATTYFLVIFTGQLLAIFFVIFAPGPIQLFPASAMAVILPLMVNRMILSLKRAGSSPNSGRSPSGPDQLESLRFARRTIGGTGRGGGDIPLRSLTSGEDDLPWGCE